MRATPRLLAVLLLLPLLLHAPAAGAEVTFAPPPSFARLVPASEGSVLTNVGHEVGRYWWSNGTFHPYATLEPMTAPAEADAQRRILLDVSGRRALFLASPDGEWLLLHNETWADEPWNRTSRTLALHVPTGEAREVRGDLRLAAAGARHVALWEREARAFLVYEWGAWDAPRALAHESLEHAEPHRIAVGDAPPRLALVGNGSFGGIFRLVDIARDAWWQPRPFDEPSAEGSRGRIVEAAFSPDGRWLAILTSQEDAFSQLFLVDVRLESTTVRAEPFVEEGMGLAWSDRGLAVAFVARPRGTVAQQDAVMRLFPEPENLSRVLEARHEWEEFTGGLAWHEGRLLAGTPTGLMVHDDELRLAFTSRQGRPPVYPSPEAAPTPTPPPPPTSAEREPTATPTGPSPDATNGLPAPPAWLALALAAALVSAARRPSRRRRRGSRP